MAPEPTYSISVRIKRTVIEQPDGSGRVSGEKVFAAAIEIGQTQELTWRREGEPLVEIHPLQTPPPGYPADDVG